MPVTRLKTVVLPAPFGPIRLTISPSSTCRSRRSATREAAEGLRHVLELEERRSLPSHDLHARRSEQALRADGHQGDEQRAEEDPARDCGLLDEAGLPDDRGEVERRHEQDRAPPAVDPREGEDGDDERDVGDVPEVARAPTG